MAESEHTLSTQEIETLVHDVLANDTLEFDKVRTLAVLRTKKYDDPEGELARIEAEFRTPSNLLIADQSMGRAIDRAVVAADLKVTADLLAQRAHRQEVVH